MKVADLNNWKIKETIATGGNGYGGFSNGFFACELRAKNSARRMCWWQRELTMLPAELEQREGAGG